MTVGERIRQYREQAEMTQEDLAGKLGITHSAVSLIEADKRGVTVEKLRRIADALGVSLMDLLEDKE